MRTRQIEPDNFLKNILKANNAKPQVNNTPIRFRENNQNYNNKENTHMMQNKQFKNQTYKDIKSAESGYYDQNSNSSSRLALKKKQTNVRTCVNHGEIEAEFRIMIDNEILNYCNKCAAHLASNGFQVDRIAPSSKSPRRVADHPVFQTFQQPRSPASRRKVQLNSFLSSLINLQQNYKRKDEYLQKVSQSYNIEKETITNFYASMIDYIEYIRNEHLKFNQQESLRNTQMCEILSAEINETEQQLAAMHQDIDSNVDKIIEDIDEDSYNECMSFYNQKYQIHNHRLEYIGAEVKLANCTTKEYVDTKLQEFKEFIDDMTGFKQSVNMEASEEEQY